MGNARWATIGTATSAITAPSSGAPAPKAPPWSRRPFSSWCLLASERDGQLDAGAGLGFLLLAWASLLVILAAAPAVYDQALRLPTGDRRAAEPGFLAAISGLIALLATNAVRGSAAASARWIIAADRRAPLTRFVGARVNLGGAGS